MGKRSENYCLRIKTAGILYLAGAQACKKKIECRKSGNHKMDVR
jgi:hypothetical protein